MNSISKVFVETLNDLSRLDPEAFSQLVNTRIQINPQVVEHPVIIVSTTRGKDTMSVLGLINGVLKASGNQRIAAVVDNDQVKYFILLTEEMAQQTDAPVETPKKP